MRILTAFLAVYTLVCDSQLVGTDGKRLKYLNYHYACIVLLIAIQYVLSYKNALISQYFSDMQDKY